MNIEEIGQFPDSKDTIIKANRQESSLRMEIGTANFGMILIEVVPCKRDPFLHHHFAVAFDFGSLVASGFFYSLAVGGCPMEH